MELSCFYPEIARGVVSLKATGGIAPNREGIVFPNTTGLFSKEDLDGHRYLSGKVHITGGKITKLILHAGRYDYGKNCVAPSPI